MRFRVRMPDPPGRRAMALGATLAMTMVMTTILAMGMSPAVADTGRLAGRPAPDFALKATTGENLRLSEYRGQVVLLTFWAEWCGRCTLQLDALAALQSRYGDRGLQVLTVNIDPADGAARETAARLGLPVLRDRHQAVARQYDLDQLPVALVLDQAGQVRHVHSRYRDGDAADYEAELRALLDPAPRP